LVQQSSRGHGSEQVALLASEHAGEHVSRNVHVGHHVHLPDALPVIVDCLWTAAHPYACVRAEDVDATMNVLDLLDQTHDVGLTRDVALNRFPADLLTNGLSTITFEIRYHNRLRMVLHESPRERSSDASSYI